MQIVKTVGHVPVEGNTDEGTNGNTGAQHALGDLSGQVGAGA